MTRCSRSRLASFVALIGLLVPGGASQTSPTLAAGQESSNQLAASSQGAAKLPDKTCTLDFTFEHVASHTSRKYLIETMGSGVALFDYDNDGRLDIFAVNGAPLSDPTPKGTIPQKTGPKYWNRLYHQKPDGTFEDVTEKAGLQGVGYGMGVAVGDYDNDGYEDLYVSGYGGNRLYHNNGDGTFTPFRRTASSMNPRNLPTVRSRRRNWVCRRRRSTCCTKSSACFTGTLTRAKNPTTFAGWSKRQPRSCIPLLKRTLKPFSPGPAL